MHPKRIRHVLLDARCFFAANFCSIRNSAAPKRVALATSNVVGCREPSGLSTAAAPKGPIAFFEPLIFTLSLLHFN
jgi:hypothetical protein